MIAKKYSYIAMVLFALMMPAVARGADWPVYKGNIFYTGNNDEITVKNNNLKWLFQASDTVFNPIISDGMVYFVDMKKNVYCLEEESGKLKWKISLTELSKRFLPSVKSAGKVKYPLVKDHRLILTDNFVIYCLDKRSGRVLWARTGMRDEKELFDRDSDYNKKTPTWGPGVKNWDPTKHSTTLVDGIYSDPVIRGDMIYYGTRNVFISREIEQGHLKWDNKNVKSWSGFPSFYDDYIFTQSMDYTKNAYALYCLDANTGATRWSNSITKPVRIFSPVVYQGRVYLAAGSVLHCFNLSDGAKIWAKDYGNIITSNPSFTEREILFTTGNRQVVIINPQSGGIAFAIDLGEKSSPYFVTIRDQIYLASTFKKCVGGRDLSYASLRALRFGGKNALWEFVPPFPGGAYQPAASGGIMFVPAANYLYAVGTDYYSRIIDGGSAIYDPYNRHDDGTVVPDRGAAGKKETSKEQDKKNDLRKIRITVKDKEGNHVKANVDIRKWDRGKVVYSDRKTISGSSRDIDVPDADDVEITADADGYVPKKVIISRDDKEKSITLDRIEKGKGIVVENIHFEIDEAYLLKESLNVLDRMIDAMKRNPRIKLEVRGHTDITGTHAHNMKLSERRADAVREYMIKNGISPERLVAIGFGPDRPIADNKTGEGRRLNRRTEFYILDK
ncbi:MAG: PQQ-binding-like beta-propeller repeat protein [Spirochaetes bacterium]|nr:PQQ-binding-like beta-propeller repeat protein [Spirochaetota bacterium]